MNPTLAPLFARRSIRTYQDKPISAALIQDVLEAGMSAPSARAKDPWEILVIQRPEMLARIAAGLPNGPMLAHAAVGFVVCGDIERAHDRNFSFLLQDVSACIENMLLALSMLELGGVWIGVHPREERMEHVRGLFRLPTNILPIGVIAAGYPADTPPPRTRYAAERVHQENW